MDSHRPDDLAATWRKRAVQLRPYAPSAAKAFDTAATELEASLRAEATEVLTLPEAALESGYSADHLGALVREGKIPNAGRLNAPRIRRADLPRKPTTAKQKPEPTTDLDAIAREILTSNGMRGGH